jgi:hypothetical protein
MYGRTEDRWAKEINVRGCDSGCGGNRNEPVCGVKIKELNEWLCNCWLLRRDFSP